MGALSKSFECAIFGHFCKDNIQTKRSFSQWKIFQEDYILYAITFDKLMVFCKPLLVPLIYVK